MSEIKVGDRVRAHDDDYDADYEGVVTELRETHAGLLAIVKNELPGVFGGKPVGLAYRQGGSPGARQRGWEPGLPTGLNLDDADDDVA